MEPRRLGRGIDDRNLSFRMGRTAKVVSIKLGRSHAISGCTYSTHVEKSQLFGIADHWTATNIDVIVKPVKRNLTFHGRRFGYEWKLLQFQPETEQVHATLRT